MSGPGKILLLAVCCGVWLAEGGKGLERASLAQQPMAPAKKPGPPFPEGERLVYQILWPSGLSLGEAVFRASAAGNDLRFELTVEAELPQHNLSDSFLAVATREGLCSLQFQQKIREGSRSWEESIEFDQKAHQARRTRGSQTSTAPIPECARDPLTFLYYWRSQLSSGQPPAAAAVHLGANVELRIRAAGQETVRIGGRQQPAEKFVVTYTRPNSERTFELWVSADSVRAPLRVRVPFPLAVFSAELQ